MTQFYVNGEKNIQRRFSKGKNYANVSFFYFIEIPKAANSSSDLLWRALLSSQKANYHSWKL